MLIVRFIPPRRKLHINYLEAAIFVGAYVLAIVVMCWGLYAARH